MATVAVIRIGGKDKKIVGNKTYLIGRGSSKLTLGRKNCFLFEDATLDLKHALIVATDDEVYIHDLNSSQGTFVNNKRLIGLDRKRLVGSRVALRFGNLEAKISLKSQRKQPQEGIGSETVTSTKVLLAKTDFVENSTLSRKPHIPATLRRDIKVENAEVHITTNAVQSVEDMEDQLASMYISVQEPILKVETDDDHIGSIAAMNDFHKENLIKKEEEAIVTLQSVIDKTIEFQFPRSRIESCSDEPVFKDVKIEESANSMKATQGSQSERDNSFVVLLSEPPQKKRCSDFDEMMKDVYLRAKNRRFKNNDKGSKRDIASSKKHKKHQHKRMKTEDYST